MPKNRPLSDAEKMRRKTLARWENEGGANACGPQVPGLAKDCEEGEKAETDGNRPADDLTRPRTRK